MAQFRTSDGSDGSVVVSIEGDFDLADVDEFLELALPCLERSDRVEIDLGRVTFIDSSGLGALVRVRKEGSETGTKVSLVDVSPATHRLLEITGLHHAFDIAPREA